MNVLRKSNDKFRKPWCTLELQFHWEMAPVSSRITGEGEYIGTGDGIIQSNEISGKVRWDLFEKREKNICRSNLIGIIETDDGALICFDSRGFFLKPHEHQPDKWISSAAVFFSADDPRYAWLNTRLAIWDGTFDMATFHHHYEVYFSSPE